MAFKPVMTNAIDIKKHENKPFEGTFLKGEEKDGTYGKNWIWHFVDQDEMPFSIYGFTMLSRAMQVIKPGTLCRITYKGTEKVQTKRFGLKDVHQVLVETDDGEGKAANGKEKAATFDDGMPVEQEVPF